MEPIEFASCFYIQACEVTGGYSSSSPANKMVITSHFPVGNQTTSSFVVLGLPQKINSCLFSHRLVPPVVVLYCFDMFLTPSPCSHLLNYIVIKDCHLFVTLEVSRNAVYSIIIKFFPPDI